ncbi:hypothetical protein RND81_11G218800 [Saponaria officinalis]|uniref:EF-hand domain-containing protein n=1 Tax=Saponaria officinalis TaxID=3572 RepID=A0AAW1HPX9_SAPOF
MSKISFLNAYGINLSKKSSILKSHSTIIPKPSKIHNSQSFQPNMEEMRRVFDKYDRNDDGKVSKDEYKAMLRAISGNNMIKEIDAIKYFKVVDKDGDGFIDFMEFMELHNNKVKSKDIEGAFRVFDKDGDGKICASELMDVMNKMGQKYNLESCKKMIKEVDCDGDGLINLSEFVNMMTSTMNLV